MLCYSFQHFQDILTQLIPMHINQNITMTLSLPIFNVVIFSSQLPQTIELEALQLTHNLLSVVVYATGPNVAHYVQVGKLAYSILSLFIMIR